MGHVFFR
jgi:Stabilization of polarity axis